VATIKVQRENFDIGAEFAALSAGRTNIGGIGCSWMPVPTTRWTRRHDRHYGDDGTRHRGLPRKPNGAGSCWHGDHRVGRLVTGDNIVLVLAAALASPHCGVPDRLAEDESAVLEEEFVDGGGAGWRRGKPTTLPRPGGRARFTPSPAGSRLR
jgi:hypothetical protein